MLYTSLNFRIYVTDFEPASYQLESTLSLFRDNTPVPLFLFRVWTAQQSKTRLLSLVQFWTLRWAVQKWSLLLRPYKFIFMAALKVKAVVKIEIQQTWKT